MSKSVLDYTEEELRALSTQELNTLLHEAESLESRWNTSQLVSKTLMNSLYGAMANKWFPLFNEDMAAAITGNGRYFIRKLSNYIEDALQRLLPRKNNTSFTMILIPCLDLHLLELIMARFELKICMICWMGSLKIVGMIIILSISQHP